MNDKRDKIRGCLIGGAAGDALGYAVEFYTESTIFEDYGKNGITEYELDFSNGKALISDDTQMTLFTANGILIGETRLCLRGIGGVPHFYVPESYQDWLMTQELTFKEAQLRREKGNHNLYGTSWLLDVPELFSRRAPGGTCLSALIEAREKGCSGSFVDNPCNNSKGCGAVMRIAPLGIHYGNVSPEILAKEAAELSAITHGHPLGYMPSAVLTLMLQRIVYEQEKSELKEIVLDALDATCEVFSEKGHTDELCHIIELAVELAENDATDLDNIHLLGQGWVAEEALAIAIYCALRHKDDFSKGIIAAVNHSGDSDSTGAITGNILGAYLGCNQIEEKWKSNLELADVILEIADDLCQGCQMGEYSSHRDPAWESKYMMMKRYKE